MCINIVFKDTIKQVSKANKFHKNYKKKSNQKKALIRRRRKKQIIFK